MKKLLLLTLYFSSLALYAVPSDNQTPDTTPIITDGNLPFRVEINLADLQFPNGIHSYVYGMHKGKILFLAGRTNGMHTFNNNNDNFPPQDQNRVVYVVDPKNNQVFSRALESDSGLTVEQIDTLSVTSPQFYQRGNTLYITGGYGVKSSTGEFGTKDTLTALDVPGFIDWVTNPEKHPKANKLIRQISNPIFQVTGGDMYQIDNHPTLLALGQNFQGYYLSSSNGVYSEQVRRFWIKDDGKKLSVKILSPRPSQPDENLRRRDLNIVPVVQKIDGKDVKGLVAFSGVFTLDGGAWTVPVTISSSGKTDMKNPLNPNTFKQGMNNYAAATAGLFSSKHADMYTIFFGGISYGFFQNGIFQTDSELPFINQVTAIKIDKDGQYTQYLLPVEYPVILSTQSNPGNQLLFGANAHFIPAEDIEVFNNEVVKLDNIHKPKVIGYIYGGIESTLPNTNVASDSAASPYIFEVVVTPNH